MATINLATLMVLLKLNSQQYEAGTEKAKKKTADLNKLIGGALVGALAAATAAAVQFGKESVQEFQTFEKGIKEVYTLLPGISQEAMGQMQDDVLAFSKETGRLSDEVIPGVYQAISAGVPPDNIFDFMQIASDAALGGVTDLETAVDGISSAVNAYGAETLGAQKASDLMFTAVKGGKTTFEELSGSMFNVIPTAASLNVEFGNITAALASMTAQGVPTSVATTQLRQLLVELSKEGSEAAATFEKLAGKSFREFIAEGGNLQGALQIMEEGAADLDVGINDLFGSVEAGSAALALTGEGTAKFTQELNNATEAAGATAEAAEVMAGSMDHLEARADAVTEAYKIQMGEAIGPIKQAYLELKIATLENAMANNTMEQQSIAAREALIAQGLSTSEAERALVKLSLEGRVYSGTLEEAEAITRRAAIASDLLAKGFEGSTKELANAVLRIEAADNASNDYSQSLEALNQMAAEQAAAQEEANQAHQDWIDMGGGAVSAATDYSMSLDELRRMGAEAAQVQREELAVAEEEAAAAALKAAEAVRAHEAEMGKFFVSALNATDGAGFFNESLDELGDQLVTVGGRTAEQNADLASLREAYDKAAGTVRDYELGIKGANLTDDERAAKIAEQQELMAGLAASMDPLLAITGEVSSKNVEATINQEAVNQAIFDAAAAAGGSATELAVLGGALGLYSEEATEAALKSALIQEKINMLAAAYVAGDASVAQMREELALFINDLDNTAGEMLATQANADALTSSTGSLGAEIGNVSAAAIEAATNLGNIPSDIPVHISITSDPIPSLPNVPSGGQATKDQAFALGGFTGGTEGDIAGLVHGQEFVFSAPAVRSIGLPALEMLHSQGLQGGGNSSFSVGDVYVTPGASDSPIEYGRASRDGLLKTARSQGLRI